MQNQRCPISSNNLFLHAMTSPTVDNEDIAKVPSKTTKKLLKKLLKEPVDIAKVNIDVVKPWITTQLEKILPDDDVAVGFILELVFGTEYGNPSVTSIAEQLQDFVGKEESDLFCLNMWQLLLDAQESDNGIPKQLVRERAQKLEKQADAKARMEADLILQLIRSAAKGELGRKTKSRMAQRSQRQNKGRVEKKTNYNRS